MLALDDYSLTSFPQAEGRAIRVDTTHRLVFF